MGFLTGGSGEFLSNPAYYRIDKSEKEMLNLNIWTPEMEPSKLKPVIFWLHGGGYAAGSSMELLEYDGRNIAKFGGDPSNVTIDGQSGGSQKVCQLMAMPSADGLFSKVVAQSSGVAEFTNTKSMAQEKTDDLIVELGLSELSDEEVITSLQTMPYETLVAAAGKVGITYAPIVDNEFVMKDISRTAGKIPLMVGSVQGEFASNYQGIYGSYRNGSALQNEDLFKSQNRKYVTEDDINKMYEQRYGDNAEDVKEAFTKAYPGHDIFDGLYTFPRNNNVASFYTENGGEAYEFVVAYNLPLFGGIVSWHTGGDIAFFFRNLDLGTTKMWLNGDEIMASKVSDEMSSALVNFVYTGNPSQKGLDWPNFTTENGEIMVFDRESEVRNYFDSDFQKLIAR